ncbi:MAG: RNA 2',3'-cyclic phosphodiesterase [Candidatus Wenzhouxiangella sp. M2_3B_020]
MTKAETRRLFFALWPDPEIRAAIADRREALGRLSKRRVPQVNLHATLLFLGDVRGDLVDSIASSAEDVRGSPFGMNLDRFGWFARARVVWLGGPAPATGKELVADLAAAMASIGVQADRRPWVPHVTLFRKVAGRPVLPEPVQIHWPVEEFALVESIPGRPYQVLRTWPLQ